MQVLEQLEKKYPALHPVPQVAAVASWGTTRRLPTMHSKSAVAVTADDLVVNDMGDILMKW